MKEKRERAVSASGNDFATIDRGQVNIRIYTHLAVHDVINVIPQRALASLQKLRLHQLGSAVEEPFKLLTSQRTRHQLLPIVLQRKSEKIRYFCLAFQRVRYLLYNRQAKQANKRQK